MLRARVFPPLLVCCGLVAQSPTGPVKLSLQDAIKTSLENNLQVQIASETRSNTKAGILVSQGAFDWTLSSSFSWYRQETSFNKSTYEGGTPFQSEYTNWNRNLTAELAKPFEWGGNLRVSYAPSYNFTRNITNPSASTLYPYSGSIGATYSQSLLRGFGRSATEANVIVAKNGAIAADFTFQQKIIDLVANTESLYWDVVFTQRNLENKEQALKLAQKQLRENQIRVEVGTLAPIEVTSAEAAEAQRQQEIIAAEAQLANAKDALIRALYPSSERPASMELTEAPTLSHISIDEKGAEKMALDRRVELKSARLDLKSKLVLEGAAKNRLLPQLDAFVGYNGLSDNYSAIGSVNGDLFKNHNPGHSFGLNVSIPLPNRTARGLMSQARANRRSSELIMRDLELGITLEVRTAFRNVDATEKAVKAAEKTRIFRQKDLEAEQKKYENGMSTNFLVLSKQNDLDNSKSLELQSQISYAKAVTTLEKALGNLLEARKLEVK